MYLFKLLQDFLTYFSLNFRIQKCIRSKPPLHEGTECKEFSRGKYMSVDWSGGNVRIEIVIYAQHSARNCIYTVKISTVLFLELPRNLFPFSLSAVYDLCTPNKFFLM